VFICNSTVGLLHFTLKVGDVFYVNLKKNPPKYDKKEVWVVSFQREELNITLCFTCRICVTYKLCEC
jgi:hypothetical protein